MTDLDEKALEAARLRYPVALQEACDLGKFPEHRMRYAVKEAIIAYEAAKPAPEPAPSPGAVQGSGVEAEIRRAASALINNLWVEVYSGSRTFEENWRAFDQEYPGVKWLHDALKLPAPAAGDVREALKNLIDKVHEFGTFKIDGEDDPLDAFDDTVVPALVAGRAALSAPASAPGSGVPDGWKLVPVEPTEAMILAGVHHENMGDMAGRYAAMLAASPSPAQGETR